MKNATPLSLNTINDETLMNKPLQPLNFVVETLLSQGLHILAGSPKVGESWLAVTRCQGRIRLGYAGEAGNHAVPLPGGFSAPHPEPVVRRDGGRTSQCPLLYGELYPG